MTNAEEKLIEMMGKIDDTWLHRSYYRELAKAILKEFPQIEAEKVFSGKAVQLTVTSVYKDTVTQGALWGATELSDLDVFIRIKE